ncbi:phage tail tape measure protein [uncultured Deinococcus sp.]|uniref:phage tail tape measure protein n=1 Tax=uncultured Deinococcus sp. TaxID=158789 RepID=UPI002589A0FC|nr:phage tail tape measure protein [uncultured Deinococcus sp.]
MTSGGGAGGQAGTVYVDVRGRFDEFEARIRQLEADAAESGDRAGSALGGAFSAGLKVATVGAVALAGAVVAIGASTFNLAQEAAQNVSNFQAQLGATREEAEKLGSVAEQVFGNNFGESLEDAGAAVGEVRKQLGDLSDQELQKVTEGALALKDSFGTEVPESVSAAKTLMQQFGLTSQEALDFLAKGYQDGLDRSGDLLDTINEYSTQFSSGGASADQFFNIIKNGAQGGSLGTDRAADAFKEFRVRIQDGSKGVATALEQVGINSEDLSKKMASGQITAIEAFNMVQKALAGVKDENLRMQAGVALIGTQYEDLGQKGAAALKTTGTSLKDMAGATDSLNAKYNNLGSFVEGMGRKLQVALLPVGKELLSMANEAVPYLQRAFDRVGAVLPGLIRQGIDTAKQFGTTAVNVYNSVRPAIESTIQTVEKLSSFLNRNKEILIPLTAAVGAGAAAFGAYRLGVAAVSLATTVWTAAQTAATVASVALRAGLTFLTGPVGLVIAAITLLVGAGVALYRNWDEVKAFAEKTWGRIKEIVAGALNSAAEFLKGLDWKELGLNVVQGLINGILTGPRLVLAAARNLGSAVINGIKDVLNIQSPSRVMKELGEFTSAGFVQGIESTRPNVLAAAQATAKGFLAAFHDLKAEQAVGNVDVSTYTKTLDSAATQLRAKLKTVKEGTPAYTEWLKALGAVTKELDSLKGKSSDTQKGAKDLADQLAQNRKQIEQGEAMERYVTGLRSATSAQLAAALATARTGGETEKYNAIRNEQRRREDEVTAAQNRATDAAQRARQQLADNRAQIAATEAQERYEKGLRSASAAQLASALSTARAAGDTEKYNLIKAEQERRLNAATAAHDRATDAARREAEAVREGQAAIREAHEYDAYLSSLNDLTDAELALELARQEAAGHQQQYNDVLSVQRQRAQDAAQAVSALAEGVAAADAALADLANNPIGERTDRPGLPVDTAAQQRQNFSDLYDTLTQLDDATIDNADTMELLDKMLQNTAQSGGITAEQLRILQGVLKGTQNSARAMAEGVEAGDAALREVLARPIGERTDRAGADEGIYPDLLRQITALDVGVEDAGATLDLFTDLLDNAGRTGALTAEQITHLKNVLKETTDAATQMALGVEAGDEALREVLANPVDEGTFRPDVQGNAQRETFENLKATLLGLDLTTIQNADAMKLYSDMVTNAGKSGGLTTEQLALLNAQLARMKLLSDVDVDVPLSDLEQAAEGTVKRLDDLVRSFETGQITGEDFAGQVFGAVPALERLALAARKAGNTELADDLTATSGALQGLVPAADAAAYSQTKLASARQKLAEAQAGGARPFASDLAALEALRGKPGIVAAELDTLIAKYRELQAETERKKGLEDRINEWGKYAQQIIPVVTGAMQALGGASDEVAGQWASDLGDMVGDLVTFGTAIAKGDYIGAAVQALTTIFNWFNRNKKAAEDAAKATREYNEQFRFAAGTAGDNYGSRTTGSYTTGFLFWSTTHYTEQIDQLKRDVALSVEGGFANGIKDGFSQAVAKNDFSLFEKSLKSSVGRAVLDGLIESFINQAVIAKIIGPAIDAYLQTGDTAALQTAIQAASGEAKRFYTDVLQPIAQEFGLVGSDAAGGTSGAASSFGGAPGTSFGATLSFPQSALDELRGAYMAPAVELGTHVARFGGIITRLEAAEARASSRAPSYGLESLFRR